MACTRVQNPEQQLSNSINLVVNAPSPTPPPTPAPTLSTISPNPVTGSNNPITFTLNGSHFVSGARVQVAYSGNGYTWVYTNTNPTYINSTQLTVPITTTTQPDTWHVRVQNPDGQFSNSIKPGRLTRLRQPLPTNTDESYARLSDESRPRDPEYLP